MSKFLSITGLEHLWAKIKAHVLQNGIFYGTCGTAQATAAKVATVTGVTELKTGITIAVKFTAANTAANPTLNVNSLGAKAIKRYGTTAPSTSAASSWNANSVITLTYDGTYWQMHDWNNTTYSSMTVAEYEAGTGTTARTITPARLKAAIQTWAVPPTRTINGHALSSDITLVEGLTPLIGTSSSITPAQVATALGEGRDICISHTGVLNNVNLELKFTSWNRATDTDYGGNAIDAVVSHSIAYYNSTYYLFELVGTGGAWDLNNTSLAKTTDIPTVSVDRKTTSGTNIADLTINGTTTQLYAPTGGGGTSDYDSLSNRPQINSTTLTGDKSSSDLGLADASHTHTKSQITDFPTIPTITESTGSITFGTYKIMWGSESINLSSGTSGSGTFAAPYRKDSSSIALSFSGTPYVWLQVYGAWTGTTMAFPIDVASTSFKIRLLSSSTSNSARAIRWLAIGKA